MAVRAFIPRLREPVVLVELFAIANLAFLAVDIAVAHAVNAFSVWSQWVPLLFSIIAPGLLVWAWRAGGCPAPPRGRARIIGLLVGFGALAVGIGGMIEHLDSRFFERQTLHHLVYTAPFIAPLAYAGVGFLVLLNRMVPSNRPEWATWVALLALGGAIGNVALSLADHAQNGFFYTSEWIPVVTAAVVVGFIVLLPTHHAHGSFRAGCIAVLLLSMLVGVIGFGLHATANLRGEMTSTLDNFIFGAPVFAPLLFPNIALLALIALYALRRTAPGKGRTAETQIEDSPWRGTQRERNHR